MEFIFYFEVIGTIIFALQGSLVAINHGLDLFGVMVLALTTAVGGGMTRDIILGNTPPNMFRDPIYCILAFVTAFIVVGAYRFVHRRIDKKFEVHMKRYVDLLDAIGLGIFTVVGMQVCMQAGYRENLFLCTFVGVLTGVGGGVIRDVLVSRTPIILRKEIYAVAAIVGGILYWYLEAVFVGNASVYIATFVITMIRLLALKKDIHLPTFKGKNNKELEQ